MSKKQSASDNNLKQEEKLQALVLLDSYSNSFEPLSSHRAECLLPLIGDKALLETNIEFLIENDVKEVVLFWTRHHAQIKAYIDANIKKWQKHIEIHVLYSFKCQSLGDAMREIDAKGIIRSNFILLTAASVVTNLRVSAYLETHKQTCKSDKNAVMTMMCINKMTDLSNSISQTLNMNTNESFFVHNINRRVLHYEQILKTNKNSKRSHKFISLPISLLENAYQSSKQSTSLSQQAVDAANAKFKLQNQTNLSISSLHAMSGYQGGSMDTIAHLKTIQHRNDLLDTQIYLCNPYVLHTFTDNFDYETMSEFIHGVLANEEVSGYTIYIDTFDRKYGTHFSLINNLNSYFYECMRLLQRVDLVLDFDSTALYRRMLDRVHVHLSKHSLTFGNDCFFNRNVFIEKNCHLGENCELVNCWIGQNCVIGNNVKVSNCIIWPNTRIGNNCTLNACLIGSNVRIGNNCRVSENTLLSNDCSLKDGTNLLERAVYVPSKGHHKKDTHLEMTVKFEELNLSEYLNVKEDSYAKYILSHKSYADDGAEDTDGFGTDNDEFEGESNLSEEDEEDNESQEGDNNHDTSKNRQFYVVKVSAKKGGKSHSTMQKQKSYASDGEFSVEDECEFDNTSLSSLDEDEEDDEDYDEHENNMNQDEYAGENEYETHHHKDDTDIFYLEVVELLKSGLKENLDPDNIILEVNSRKHANNIQIEDLCYYFAKALLYLPISLNQSSTYFESIKGQLAKQTPILKNYYTKTRQSQNIFMNAFFDFFIENQLVSQFAVKTIHYMFDDCEFLSDECIVQWYEKKLKEETKLKEAEKNLLKKMEPFIEWLKEDEESEEEDED